MKRREFMERSLVAAGAVALGGAATAAEEGGRQPKTAVDRVPLGKTGLTIPFLGIGTGTVGYNNASNQTRIGQEAFTRLIRHAYDQGVRYLDAADSYGSHAYLRQAIKGLPRDAFFIQTKIINRSAEEAKADLDRFRKELGTDYFDSVLIHVVTKPTWVEDLKCGTSSQRPSRRGSSGRTACRATRSARCAPQQKPRGWRSTWPDSIRRARTWMPRLRWCAMSWTGCSRAARVSSA
jgi:hypothetical protein